MRLCTTWDLSCIAAIVECLTRFLTPHCVNGGEHLWMSRRAVQVIDDVMAYITAKLVVFANHTECSACGHGQRGEQPLLTPASDGCPSCGVAFTGVDETRRPRSA